MLSDIPVRKIILVVSKLSFVLRKGCVNTWLGTSQSERFKSFVPNYFCYLVAREGEPKMLGGCEKGGERAISYQLFDHSMITKCGPYPKSHKNILMMELPQSPQSYTNSETTHLKS